MPPDQPPPPPPPPRSSASGVRPQEKSYFFTNSHWKHWVTNYRIGGVGPSNQDQGEGKGQKVEKQQNFFSIFKKAKPATGSSSQS